MFAGLLDVSGNKKLNDLTIQVTNNYSPDV